MASKRTSFEPIGSHDTKKYGPSFQGCMVNDLAKANAFVKVNDCGKSRGLHVPQKKSLLRVRHDALPLDPFTRLKIIEICPSQSASQQNINYEHQSHCPTGK